MEDEQRQELRIILKRIVAVIASEIENEVLVEIEKPKRLWQRKWISRRIQYGASDKLFRELIDEDPTEFCNAMRMTEDKFNSLLTIVGPAIEKSNTYMRNSLSAEMKLQIFLYMINHGCSLRTLSHLFRVSKSAVSLMIPEIADAIYSSLKDYIKMPNSPEEWKVIEKGFATTWNFPGCCGAIDGKHIVIKAPCNSGSYYFNYKHQNSIVLMALVDHDYCFTYIDVGCNGRVSDGGVFSNCSLSHALENNLLPDNHVIVGDNAFPLKMYLMKPYAGNNLSYREKIFNYRLSRARRIVENAFGILAARFRIFEKPIPYLPTKVDKIVKCCCALHNWLTKTKSAVQVATTEVEDSDGNIIPGSWRDVPSAGLARIRNMQNRSSRQAQDVRNRYADFFQGAGSVPWQGRMVH